MPDEVVSKAVKTTKKPTKKRKRKRASPTGENRTNDKVWIPNPRQRIIVELLLNPEDKRNKTEKLIEAGVRKSTFYDWMKDPRFLNYLNSQLDKYTDGEVSEVWKALVFKATKIRDTAAIKLFFEMKGMYSEKVKVDHKHSGKVDSNVNVIFNIPRPPKDELKCPTS